MAKKYKESQLPTNTPSSQTRRSALKKMLVGTGVAAGAAALPDKWAKPIVDKVLIPVHAQTSPCEIVPGVYCWSYDIGFDADFYMEIKVEADGTVEIETNPFGPNFDPISVPITGGSFTAETDGATIKGEIVCNEESITGTVEFLGLEVGTVDFTATVALCV